MYLAGLCLLQACSQFPTLLHDDVEQVQQLLAQQNYYQALDVIDRASPDAPDYSRLAAMRGDVLAAIKEFEQSQLDDTQALINRDEWAKALVYIDEALEKAPASKALTSKRKNIQRVIDREVAEISLALAIARAKSLPDEIKLLEKLSRYLSDDSQQALIAERHSVAMQDRKRLIDAAKQKINRQHWPQARVYASLADQLKRDRQTQNMLAQINRRIINSDIQQLRQALDENNLVLAQQLAAGLRGKQQDMDIQELITALNEKVAIVVLQLTRDGQQAYTQGNIESAIEFWENAVQLDPENTELEKRLGRARAFRKNYQRLKQD